ncbi:hypothetical protein JG688_00016949, partial [Phytophthora aleatoria]
TAEAVRPTVTSPSTSVRTFIQTTGARPKRLLNPDAAAREEKTAKRDPGTEHLAQKLQYDLLAAWGANELSTDVVFKLLKVDEENAKDLFTTPAFHVWSSYFSLRNHYNPDKDVDMMNQLLASFNEFSLAKSAQLARKDDAINATLAMRAMKDANTT